MKDYISTVIDSSVDYTDTFDKLVTTVRTKLARLDNLINKDAIVKDRMTRETTENNPQDN